MAIVLWLTTVTEQASSGPARSTCSLPHQPGLGASWENLFYSGGAEQGERPIPGGGCSVQSLHFSEPRACLVFCAHRSDRGRSPDPGETRWLTPHTGGSPVLHELTVVR